MSGVTAYRLYIETARDERVAVGRRGASDCGTGCGSHLKRLRG